MAEPNLAQLVEWQQWLEGRPASVKATAAKVVPWREYHLRSTGQRAQPLAYAEDGTIRALCWRDDWPEEMRQLTAREVFGLDPDDFEEVKAALPLEDTTRSASRAERADEDTRITRKQIEELERCDPDFGVDGIDVVGGMSSRKNGSWLLRSDVLALFDVARSASRPEEPRNG